MLLNIFKSFLIKILKLESDFSRLFFSNEYDTLSGIGNKRIKVLISIFLFTFLALAFAVGTIDYLNARMNDPFTNIVDMPVLLRHKDKVESIESYFANIDTAKSFNIVNVNKYCKFSQEVYHYEDDERTRVLGITIDPNGRLVKEVLLSNNTELVDDDGLREEFYDGIIITKRKLIELGCTDIDGQRMLVFDDLNYRKYVPIIATVDALPDLADFACTPRLYNWLNDSWEKSGCIKNNGSTNTMVLVTNIEDDTILKKILSSSSNKIQVENVVAEEFDYNDDNDLFKYRISLNTWVSTEDQMRFVKSIKSSTKTNAILNWIPIWQCRQYSEVDDIASPHKLAFNFDGLDKVRLFKEKMEEEFEVEISMNQIEAKENFAIISRLTFLISSILFLFALFSIVLYLNNLLNNHLEKVSPNLGTFKAFGLNNAVLKKNYLNIIIGFISVSILVAFAFLICIAMVEERFNVDGSMFNIFNGWIAFAILLIFALTYLSTIGIIKKLLIFTPGDLIYNRTKHKNEKK